MDSELLLNNLYNAFDRFQPLPAGDPTYVDCREVRGDEDILEDLGDRIRRSKNLSCHLYSGHKGAGKSTELLRLKKYLEEQRFYVVYFAADAEDIQTEDAQYTDILLACTRHLLEALNESANPGPVLNWVRQRFEELKEFALSEVKFDTLSIGGQISEVAKLTANLRAEPTMRQEIREKVNPHTVSLLDMLNDFLKEAKQKLPGDCTQLAVIVDNLDRIVSVIQEDGRTNHEDIFIHHSEDLQALKCHLVYTVPISLLYSDRANDIKDIYSEHLVLPMVMVRTPDGKIYEFGLEKVKEIIGRRVSQFAPDLSLETEIFESPEILDNLCLMSGGHVRNLLLLVQDAIARTKTLPISERAVRIAISRARDVYRRTVEESQWSGLAKVSCAKRIVNEDECRKLLFNRCLLEYRYWDEHGEMQRWCDVHPLIRGIPEFKEAVDSL